MSRDPVVIIGAGLSGLYLARLLKQKGYPASVLEARDRVGGRIVSERIGVDRHASVDLGPAWVWPELQPRLSRLLAELDIKVFAQTVDGDSLWQGPDGRVQRHPGPSPHSESYRIVGGAQSLVDVLADDLGASIHLNTEVCAIDANTRTVTARSGGERVELRARKVISAIPLRLLADAVVLTPDVDEAIRRAWRAVPTWMAGHCKLLFLYDSPFWREQGLSGEASSRRGPLTEVYDGSPYAAPGTAPGYALTSFVGLGALQRRQAGEGPLVEAGLAQLEQLFGPRARDVQKVIVKDWSDEAHTTTEADLAGPHEHPHYPPSAPRQVLEGYLLLAGTEAAREYGGIIEGALESADEIVRLL